MKVDVVRKRPATKLSDSLSTISRSEALKKARMLAGKIDDYQLKHPRIQEAGTTYRLDRYHGVAETKRGHWIMPTNLGGNLSTKGIIKLLKKAQTAVDIIDKRVAEELLKEPELITELKLSGEVKGNDTQMLLDSLVSQKKERLIELASEIKSAPDGMKMVIEFRIPLKFGNNDFRVQLFPDLHGKFQVLIGAWTVSVEDKLRFLKCYPEILEQLSKAVSMFKTENEDDNENQDVHK